MKEGKIIILFVFFILAPLFSFSQRGDNKKDKLNIIFIVADDLGWNDLGVYGSVFHETPNLDKLANEGVMFTDAYATSHVCSPSRSSIFTGQYPVRTGITNWIMGRENLRGPMPYDKLLPPSFSFNLDTAQMTIAEAFKAGGYATFFAGKWHLGLSEEYWPEKQGFDINKGGWAAGNPWTYGMGGYFSPYHNPKLEDGEKGEFLPDRLTNETISFIRQKAEEKTPFFVTLSFYGVHTKLQAKKEHIQKFKEKKKDIHLDSIMTFIKDEPWMQNESNWKERIVQSNPVYAALLYSLDENVGRILQALEELKIAENTVVVFTSDNGGLSIDERSLAPTSNLPLRYGKGWNYEGGLRVPLIIKWPLQYQKGMVSDFPVINTDLYPTFLEMAHLPLRPEQHKDGISMLPLLKGEKELERKTLYWHYPHYSTQGGIPGAAIREGDWKLLQFYEDNSLELYNLKADVGERRNLAEAFPNKTGELLDKLNKWKMELKAEMPTLNPYYNPYYKEIYKKEFEKINQYLLHYKKQFKQYNTDSINQIKKDLEQKPYD